MAAEPILIGLLDELGFVAPYRRATRGGGTEWVIPEIAYYSLVCRHALGDTKLADKLSQEATSDAKELTLQAASARRDEARKMVREREWSERHAPKDKDEEENHRGESCGACERVMRALMKDTRLAPSRADLVRYYRVCTRAWSTPVFTGENADLHRGLVDPFEKDRYSTARNDIIEYTRNRKTSETVKAATSVMVDNVCALIAEFYTSRLVGRLEDGLVVRLDDASSLVNNQRLTAVEGQPGYARADLVRRGTVDTVSCAAVCMADLMAEKYGIAHSQLFYSGPGAPAAGAGDDESKRMANLCSQIRGPPLVLPRIVFVKDTALLMTPVFHAVPDEEGNYLSPPDNEPRKNVFGRIAEWLRMVALLARNRMSPRFPLYTGHVDDPAMGYVKRGANAPPPRSLGDIIATEPFVPVPVEEEIKRLTLEYKDESYVPIRAALNPSINIPEVHLERVNLVPSLWPKPRVPAGGLEYARHDPCSIFVVAAQ